MCVCVCVCEGGGVASPFSFPPTKSLGTRLGEGVLACACVSNQGIIVTSSRHLVLLLSHNGRQREATSIPGPIARSLALQTVLPSITVAVVHGGHLTGRLLTA